ncbi:MAG: hypothetical protein EOP84_05095 [Verrucomicrobiaceae bacterium]|nr:MAG: hypothetical protein EOP84_05095 [Verrucomicrobiaceae bacterium]
MMGPVTKTDIVLERYHKLRMGASAWIASADSKATALLTSSASITALGFAAFAWTSTKISGYVLFMMVTFGMCNAATIVLAGFALKPRTSRREILDEAGFVDVIVSSPSFFADIAQLDRTSFTKLIEDSEEELWLRDEREQAYVVCHIANEKMFCIKHAVWSLAASVVILMIALGLATQLQPLSVKIAPQ